MQTFWMLPCPRCDTPLEGLWFTAADGRHDEHGYISCTACIDFFVRHCRVPIKYWGKIASAKDIRKHSYTSWLTSHWRSVCITKNVLAQSLLKKKGKKKKSKKSNRRHHEIQSESRSHASNSASAPTSAPVLNEATWLKYAPTLINIVKAQCVLTATKYGIGADVANKVTSELTPQTLRPHAHMR